MTKTLYTPGHFITYTGKTVDVNNFTVDMVDIEDIAHALSMICRFGGHSQFFYSVAQHAVHVAEHLEDLGYPASVVYTGLHHDDTEAYIGDFIRPIKVLFPDFNKMEDKLASVISAKLGFEDPLPASVKTADIEIFWQELEDIKHGKEEVIKPWPQDYAKYVYLEKHRELLEKIKS